MSRDKIIGFGVGVIAIVLFGAATLTFAASNGYGDWQKTMGGRGRVSQVITENNFGRFQEMQSMMADGQYEEAAKVRTELGLGQGQGGGCPMAGHAGKGNGGGGCAAGKTGGQGAGFVDKNNNGICDNQENLK